MDTGLTLRSSQQPGQIRIDNFEQLRQSLTQVLSRYEGVVYTDAMLTEAKADKKELSRLRREIDDRRKEIKRAYLAPYNEFEAQVKELLSMVDAPLDEIKGFVSSMENREKEAKRAEIRAYFMSRSAALGSLASQVFESPAFFVDKWLNKTTSAKTWQTEVDAKIAEAARAISAIQATNASQAGALTAKYLEKLSLEDVRDYKERLNRAEHTVADPPLPAEQSAGDQRSGFLTLRLSGSVEQLIRVSELLALVDIDCEELENGMPQPMQELTEPEFDSFVAFDIETTGTYGAANGDGPAEITEIGAVKVVNGRITDRFSELVNPGRSILPRIARITHITDEMVRDKPDIAEVMGRFAEFVGDAVLVGHNIKSSDLYYIDRAARRYGISLDNAFFDTYRYAKRIQKQKGWEKVSLPYLSRVFGIEQKDAHRAWCDAETNVGVFFALKRLD